MFTIYGGKTEFEQWDLDQLITCDCLKEGDEVVFSGHGKTYETTAFTQDGKVWADVPNFLLKEPGSFRVDLGWGLNCHMDCRTTFTVTAKDKPEGYVCGENIKHRESKSGGVTSWNDLKDKPFGDLPTGGDTLTWDGNTEGLECVADGEDIIFCKLSDNTPSMEELSGGGHIVMSVNGDEWSGEWTLDVVADLGGEGIPAIILAEAVWIIQEDGVKIDGMVFPTKGLYSIYEGGSTITTFFTINGYTGFPVTKKIEEKYLPGATVLYTDGTYLYNTEDTTDESNRTTKAELWELFNRGPVHVDISAVMEMPWLSSVMCVFDEWGYAVAMFFIENPTVARTAEYTPAETTGE